MLTFEVEKFAQNAFTPTQKEISVAKGCFCLFLGRIEIHGSRQCSRKTEKKTAGVQLDHTSCPNVPPSEGLQGSHVLEG